MCPIGKATSAPSTPGLNACDPMNIHSCSVDFGGLVPHRTLISKPSLLYSHLRPFQGISPAHSMSGAGLWYPQLGAAQGTWGRATKLLLGSRGWGDVVCQRLACKPGCFLGKLKCGLGAQNVMQFLFYFTGKKRSVNIRMCRLMEAHIFSSALP